jgi:lactoylglutathione lyase
METIRLALILSFAVFVPTTLLFSQSGAAHTDLEFDHIALHVHDLAKSTEFYQQVMGLEQISEPFKDGRHVWFRIGSHSQLHVISGAPADEPHRIDVHLAFHTASLSGFMARLDRMHVTYRDFKGTGKVAPRPDGARQIYFQDPDGYWIEVNDAKS